MEVFRRMSASRRMELAIEMTEEVWSISADAIRSRHPEYDEQTVSWALHRLRFGDDLFRKVWPSAPLVPS